MAVGVQVPPSAPFKKGQLRFVGVPERISQVFLAIYLRPCPLWL